MSANARILCPAVKQRLMTAEKAAELIPAGANVGMSGFTGAGYPKVVPGALAERIRKLNAREGSEPFRINVWTGVSITGRWIMWICTCLKFLSTPGPGFLARWILH